MQLLFHISNILTKRDSAIPPRALSEICVMISGRVMWRVSVVVNRVRLAAAKSFHGTIVSQDQRA